PVKVLIEGRPVFVCCPACIDEAKEHPQQTLEKVDRLNSGGRPSTQPASETRSASTQNEDVDPKIQAALSKLSDADRQLATEQKYCPILPKSRLGSMGTPIKLMLNGQPVFVCCSACVKAAKAKPAETVQAAQVRQGAANTELDSAKAEDAIDPKFLAELEKL